MARTSLRQRIFDPAATLLFGLAMAAFPGILLCEAWQFLLTAEWPGWQLHTLILWLGYHPATFRLPGVQVIADWFYTWPLFIALPALLTLAAWGCVTVADDGPIK